MAIPATRIGNLTLGSRPLVVGTIARVQTLAQLPATVTHLCDIAELRLDLWAALGNDWLASVQEIEARGVPLVITIRLAEEGGQWTKTDEERFDIFSSLLPHISALDIESRSTILPNVAAVAKDQQRCVIVSHHDFQKTPPLMELRRVASEAARHATIVKIATMTSTDSDLETLRALLREKSAAPLCVLGMGPRGPETRVEFPRLGSCLTYGYIDEPIAPGQLPAAELLRQLRTS